MNHAAGPFEVTLTPQPSTDKGEGGAPADPALASLARMAMQKQFKGDLEGTSTGEMLSARSATEKGSAGYVAIERVIGTLHGRAGSFVLQHSGTMDRGQASLTVTVVPDSGTGALSGIQGKMTIDVTGGKHAYGFDYTLPEMG